MDGVAMVFQSELTMLDEGLYTCQASFYHHTATVNIEVEIMNKEEQLSENLPCSIFHLHWENRVTCLLLIMSTYCIWYFIRLRSSIWLWQVCVCVSALVTMICIGSALAIICITVVMFWLCWWVKCLKCHVAAWQVMSWRANEGNAAGETQYETNRM